MAKRPSFQFYPADWRNNANLRRCSHAARGAWIDILSILHDSDEYGICRWPLAELANAAGVPNKLIKELVDKHVLKGSDAGVEPYIYRPRHAGKEGKPVTLINETTAPCWYCSRFVRDEYIRTQRGKGTRFGESHPAPEPSPMPPFGGDFGDGPTSTSSSTSSKEEKKESADAQILGEVDDLDLPVSINPDRPNWAPSWEEVKTYFTFLKHPQMARRFFDTNESRGWMDNKHPIRHFQGQANNWIQNSKGKKTRTSKEPTIPDKLKKPPDRTAYYTDEEYDYAVKQRNAALTKLGITIPT